MQERTALNLVRLAIGLVLLCLACTCFGLGSGFAFPSLGGLRFDAAAVALAFFGQAWLRQGLDPESWRPLWPQDPNETADLDE